MTDAKNHVPLDEVTVKQAAHLINVSYWWLWQRIGKKGGPPYRKRGRLIKIPRDELIAWAKQPKVS
jgi:excisionase family DNA binding protein